MKSENGKWKLVRNARRNPGVFFLRAERLVVEWWNIEGREVEIVALNIKSEEAQKLAHELASLTGESMTAAVTEAVRERLERLRNQRGRGLAERLMQIGKDCAARLKEPYRSKDHGELLYDEKGLPR